MSGPMFRPMIRLKRVAALAFIACAAACAGKDDIVTDTSGGDGMPNVMSDTYAGTKAPPMDESRNVAAQDCSKAVETDRGNLRCSK
jgi:hypothetical protein